MNNQPEDLPAREQRYVIVNAGQPVCPYELHCWTGWHEGGGPGDCLHRSRSCQHCGCKEFDTWPIVVRLEE